MAERERPLGALDPSLRPAYINQETLDVYISRLHPEISSPERRLALAARLVELHHPDGETPEQVAAMIFRRIITQWAETLYPDTTLNEGFYLQGHTDTAERAAMISHLN